MAALGSGREVQPPLAYRTVLCRYFQVRLLLLLLLLLPLLLLLLRLPLLLLLLGPLCCCCRQYVARIADFSWLQPQQRLQGLGFRV